MKGSWWSWLDLIGCARVGRLSVTIGLFTFSWTVIPFTCYVSIIKPCYLPTSPTNLKTSQIRCLVEWTSCRPRLPNSWRRWIFRSWDACRCVQHLDAPQARVHPGLRGCSSIITRQRLWLDKNMKRACGLVLGPACITCHRALNLNRREHLETLWTIPKFISNIPRMEDCNKFL